MLIVDLKPDNAAVMEAGGHSVTIAYRTIGGFPYLTLNPAKSLIMVWIPMVDHHGAAVVIGDQFVTIRPLALKGPAPIVRLEAQEAVCITRLERAPALTA